MKKKRSFSVNVGTSLVLMAVGAALLSFGGLLQAQTQTYYTEFDFTGGVTVSDYMAHITTTGGVAGNIQVALTNREKTDISVAFDVVDAVQIDGGVWACQDRYIEGSTGFARGFREQGASIPGADTLSSGESQTYTFTYNFPRYYTGNYMGCILYYETDTARDVATTSRKALLVSANLSSSEVTYTVKVYPSSRTSSHTYEDDGYLRIYSVVDNTWTQETYSQVSINSNGTGSVSLILEPGTYNIVYKSFGGMASYISGYVVNDNTDEFDFTTGSNLYGTITGSINYQIPCDLPKLTVEVVSGVTRMMGTYDGFCSPGDSATMLALLNIKSNSVIGINDFNTGVLYKKVNGLTVQDPTGDRMFFDPKPLYNFNRDASVTTTDFSIMLPYVNHVRDIYDSHDRQYDGANPTTGNWENLYFN